MLDEIIIVFYTIFNLLICGEKYESNYFLKKKTKRKLKEKLLKSFKKKKLASFYCAGQYKIN